MHCNIGARSIEVNMNPAFCMIFSFLVGAFTGGVVLMIAGNKFMTKQLVAEQTKLDAELVRTKERIAAEKMRQHERISPLRCYRKATVAQNKMSRFRRISGLVP